MLPRILELLRALVAQDTQNPPRAITAEHGIFAVLREAIGDRASVEVVDHGDGHVSLLAVRGAPKVLLNCHLDTVPAAPSWSRDPFELLVDEEAGRAVGLGACDIKGAAACMIAALEQTTGPIALLFSSDEEAGVGVCVPEFVKRQMALDAVVVAEPTRCRAVLEHRGIVTATGRFTGVAGHASQARALDDSAVHELTRWAAAALGWAEGQREQAYGVLRGAAFNIGRVEGGTKPNMIADEASVRWGMRPLPCHHPHRLRDHVCGLAPRAERVCWTPGFYGPTLPAPGEDGQAGASRAETAREVAEALGMEAGDPVDFWTEAALFSAAGYTAMVCGPGDIAQAHTAGEWVALEQLERAAHIYARLMI